MCEHLAPLDDYLRAKGVKETFRGQAWSENCREWAYYDGFLDVDKLMARFHFPEFVGHHTNDDMRSGLEEGLVCAKCKDAVMGYHRRLDQRNAVTVD